MQRGDCKFGVVVFDEPQDPRSGWYAVAGGDADRFSGAHELSTDTIWWTNVAYEHFFRGQTEIWRIPSLKHDKYLVVSHVDTLREWGYDPESADPDFVCRFCSGAFDRVMRNAWRLIRDVFPKTDIRSAFRGRTLREDVRCLLPDLEYPKGPAAEVFQSGKAWEEFSPTLVKPPRGGRRITLRWPRTSYANHLLQTPVPRAPFEWVSRGDMLSKAADKTAYVLNSDRPCVANVALKAIKPEVSEIYVFGSATQKEQRTQREWVAHPEFKHLADMAEVDVRQLWIGREYWVIMPNLPEPVKDFLSDRLAEYSWSVGIVAECLWRASMLGEDKSKAGPIRDGEEKAQTSWQGLWIRSMDKVLMFQHAHQLTQKGHAVTGYGIGWVKCTVPEEDVSQLIADGLQQGLVPVFNDVPEGVFNARNLPWGGDDKTKDLAVLVATRNQNMLWNLDKVPLLPNKAKGPYLASLRQRFMAA